MTDAMVHSPQAQQLLAARGPFVSICFDDAHDAPDAAERLQVIWRHVRRELEEQRADATLVASLEPAVMAARPSAGRTGHCVIVGADGVLIKEHLVVPPPSTVVRVSELPYVVPLVEFGPGVGHYLVLFVDQLGAELTLVRGATVRTETVDPGGYPVHKSASAGVDGWGDHQHRAEEAVRKNVRAVADRLTQHLDRHHVEAVFVIGQDRIRAELMALLAERIRVQVVQPGCGARNTGIDSIVRQAIALEFQNRRLQQAAAVAVRFRAEAGHRWDLTVTGLPDVCAALREGAVETLIIGSIGNETIVAGNDLSIIAPDADTLSNFGTAPTRTLRADEAVPFAAMIGGAALVRADDSLELADGMAALLRFPLPGY